jgi:hypothetical protein
LGQHGLDGAHLHLVVVRLDRMDDVVVLTIPTGDLRADQRVAPLHFVRQCLADVMQQRPALEQRRVEAELTGHHPGNVRGFDQVLEHVLAVGRPVPELSEQLRQLRMHVGDSEVD